MRKNKRKGRADYKIGKKGRLILHLVRIRSSNVRLNLGQAGLSTRVGVLIGSR